MTRLERGAEVREQAGSVAATAAAYFQQYLTGLDSTASALVRNPNVIVQDRAQCDALFADVLRDHPLLSNIALLDTTGALKGTGAPPRPGANPSATLPYVTAVVASGTPMVSDL